MLKNKAFVKILVSVCLSVTMIGALCLPLFAAMPHSSSYEDVWNNIRYIKTVDGEVWNDTSGYVTGYTQAQICDPSSYVYYPYVYLTVSVQGGSNSSASAVFETSANSGVVTLASNPQVYAGPAMMQPSEVDYIYTQHAVRGSYDNVSHNYMSPLWSDTIVSDISDFY